MPRRRVLIEDVEFDPLEGGDMHFTFISGEERMLFAMARALVVKATGDAMRAIDTAEVGDRGKLVMFPRT